MKIDQIDIDNIERNIDSPEDVERAMERMRVLAKHLTRPEGLPIWFEILAKESKDAGLAYRVSCCAGSLESHQEWFSTAPTIRRGIAEVLLIMLRAARESMGDALAIIHEMEDES